jgi:toxin-antitoxin system PIN domain toxin
MTTLNFLDANVWLALIWGRHSHFERARQWVESVPDDQLLYCRFTQLTVLRLLTTEKLMAHDTQSMAGAWELWDRLVSDPRIEFLAEPDGMDGEFRAHSRLGSKSPKVWADAYLLAFSSLAGTRLVSFDRALSGRSVDVLVL